ncbi:MAG: hypothetical protein Q7J85_03050 [Bacillota bacterium]|nr:hypothetical protein [Bacillota bacterium]
MIKKPLAFFFLGILLLVLFLSWGLNTAERGMQEILALEGPLASLDFKLTDGELLITFAGDNYYLPYRSCLEKLRRLLPF